MRTTIGNIMNIVKQVWKNKANGQKLITIPFNCGIEDGEFVEIRKVTMKVEE